MLEDENPLERLRRLKTRREELRSRLRSINYALVSDGYAIGNHVDSDVLQELESGKASRRAVHSGIRINGQLSFRGVQKCAEYMQRLDEDKDGLLSFEDFRAMMSLTKEFGVVHESEYLDRESWRLYMDDLGVKTTHDGYIDLPSFVKYRKVVEPKQPLAAELRRVNLGFLPQLQEQWCLVKQLIDEVEEHRAAVGIQLPKGMLDLDDVSFVLSNAGVVFSRHEFLLCMMNRAPFQVTMDDLVRSSFRRHYGNSPEAFANMMEVTKTDKGDKDAYAIRVRHLKYIEPTQLMAWMFGRRPEPKNRTTYEQIIQWKQWCYRYIRKVDFITKRMYDLGTHMHLRMVFRDFQPPESVVTKEEKSFLQYHVEVGAKDRSFEDGFGATWATSKVSNAEDFCKKMKVPKECGFVLMIDFLLRADTTQAEAKKAGDAFVIFLRSHFDDELKKNQQYRGIFVFPAESEGDGAAVLRFAITYKRMVSFDAYFQQMFIPMKLFELVTELAGEFKVSVPLTELFSASLVNLDVLLSSRFSLRAALVREPIIALLHRARMALSAAVSRAEVIPPEDTEELREMNLWIALKKYFPQVVEWCNTTVTLLRGVKSHVFTFRYKNLAEYVSRLRLDNLWVKQHLPPSTEDSNLGTSIAGMYESFRKRITSDLKDTFQRVKTFLEDRIANEDARRLQLLMMTRRELEHESEKKENNELTMKLRELGIHANASDFVDEESTDLKSLLEEVNEINHERDVQALVAYERMHKACLGVHSVDVLCGQSRLTFSCHGMDFMDLLPKPPPMFAVKTACEARRKKPTM